MMEIRLRRLWHAEPAKSARSAALALTQTKDPQQIQQIFNQYYRLAPVSCRGFFTSDLRPLPFSLP